MDLACRGERPIAVLVKQLSISESCLRNWMTQAEVDDNGSETRLTNTEKHEITQLRRDKPCLEMGNEILKRAAAYSLGRTFSSINLSAGR